METKSMKLQTINNIVKHLRTKAFSPMKCCWFAWHCIAIRQVVVIKMQRREATYLWMHSILLSKHNNRWPALYKRSHMLHSYINLVATWTGNPSITGTSQAIQEHFCIFFSFSAFSFFFQNFSTTGMTSASKVLPIATSAAVLLAKSLSMTPRNSLKSTARVS